MQQWKIACKTGSTDYDNLIVAYNPNILINGWVGYDDNRKIENSQEKVLAKEVAINFLNKEIKKESCYIQDHNNCSDNNYTAGINCQ